MSFLVFPPAWNSIKIRFRWCVTTRTEFPERFIGMAAETQQMADSVRYSRLAPLSLDQRIKLSLAAMHFFAPMAYREMCEAIGKIPLEGRTEPLSAGDFSRYLSHTKLLEEPERYMHRVRELLVQLEGAGLLTEMGRGRDVVLGTHYYCMIELTKRQREGVAWLARALGPEFIHRSYGSVTVQVTGRTARGDVTAGTALVVAPTWVLTCAHVLNGMLVDESQMFGDRRVDVLRAIPHPSIDIGLIEVSSPLAQLPGLSFRNPDVSELVFTLGYPRVPLCREPALVMQRGEVTAPEVTLFDGRHLFLYSAIARPGNSGGPLLSATGHVLGIVTEELSEDSAQFSMPFYAGIPTTEMVRALTELDIPVTLPVENYE
jgi:hypothetical protein